jgi:CRISPR-associated endonuclease Csn1
MRVGNFYLQDSQKYHLISPNLYRAQSVSSKYYIFNHHLETSAANGDTFKNKKQLSGITYRFIQSLPPIKDIIKVRINHIGEIVCIGEY